MRKRLLVVAICGLSIHAFASSKYWPIQIGNKWLTCNDSFFVENEILRYARDFPPEPVFVYSQIEFSKPAKIDTNRLVKIDSNSVVENWRCGNWCGYNCSIYLKNGIIVDFAISENDSFATNPGSINSKWIKLISADSTVTVPAGTFEHCYVFSNGDIYAPNVGPIKDLVYAKVNGVEYGTYPSELTSVEIIKEHPPTDFALFQNHPNPFNNTTVINFNLPEPAEIKLTIFDVTGKEVKTILNSHLSAGSHSVRWDGTDNYWRPVASGLYFIRLQTGQSSKTIKAIYKR